MDKVSRVLTAFFEKLYALLTWVCIVLLLLIVGSTFLQVFCRKALNAPLTWSEEFSRLAFIWMSCLGCAVAVPRGQHISFDLFADRCLPRRAQKPLRIALDIMLAAFLLWTIPSTAELTAKMNGTLSAALRWPMGIFYGAFAAGCSVTALAYAGDILEALGVVRLGKGDEDVG